MEKVWPLVYRGSPQKKLTFPAEGSFDDIARPAGGYLWDRCAEAGVSYRSFGEWISPGKTSADPGKARTRMEGGGLLLIGAFILTDALAADLGRRSEVPQDWILLVWVLLAAGLIGLRYLAGRGDTKSQKPTA